jgi:hypothetical protein
MGKPADDDLDTYGNGEGQAPATEKPEGQNCPGKRDDQDPPGGNDLDDSESDTGEVSNG